jgi:hypothetical protein
VVSASPMYWPPAPLPLESDKVGHFVFVLMLLVWCGHMDKVLVPQLHRLAGGSRRARCRRRH